MGWRKLVVIPVVALGFFVLAPAASAWIANSCLSIGGVPIYQSGSATCSTTSGHNVAAAIGENSTAEATDGNKNTAFVHGDDSTAGLGGDGNKAVIHGDNSRASAGVGENADDNTAVAHGDTSEALAAFGDGNEAVAGGGGSYACAGGLEQCRPPCPTTPDDVTVECVATINPDPVPDADNNTAYAFNGGAAYAGGLGNFDWNKAVAIGNCIAAAVFDIGDSDFCKAPPAP